MSIAQSMLPEFTHEAAGTRRVLERVPEAAVLWRPHAKSYTLGDLALHLAHIPTWAAFTLNHDGIDMGGTRSPESRRWESRDALLAAFDRNVAEARDVIAATTDATMMEAWTLKKAGQVMFTLPKMAVLRSFVISHTIHHRAQLMVYLRMNDVPLPAIYGPTADEG